MRHAGVVALILLAGCAQESTTLVLVAPATGPGLVASLPLASAGENDWRKVVEVGPLTFDAGGMPIAAPGVVPADARNRRMRLRMGFIQEVYAVEDNTYEYVEGDGPLIGLDLSVGPRAGRFDIELGIDVISISGEAINFGTPGDPGGFYSNLLTARTDLLLFANRGQTRLYLGIGGRYVYELATVYRYDYEGDFLNASAAVGFLAGIRMARFDFRAEHFEGEGNDSFGVTHFTAALRF